MIVVVGLVTRIVRGSVMAQIIVLGVVFADLFIYGQTNVTTMAEATVNGWQDAARAAIASWNASDTQNFRYYTDPAIYPYPYKNRLVNIMIRGKRVAVYNPPAKSRHAL